MTHSQPPHPPRWAQKLLSWYCRPELAEDLQGDLNEFFERNLRKHGLSYARFIYWIDVLKFIRSYTLRVPEFHLLFIHYIMINSYFKTSLRSLVRTKLFSFINVVGLAISMSVGLLMIALLSDLLSYDDFHAKKSRIYRITTTLQPKGNAEIDLASSSVLAGKKIKESFPNIESVTLLRRGFGGDAQVGESTVPIGGLWADSSFFKVFSFTLRAGNPTTALRNPYSIVLPEKTAHKLFGHSDVLGKSIRFDTTNYTITGIMEDIPKLSHLRFDALVSFASIDLRNADSDGHFLNWDNVYSNYAYVLLPENGHPQTLQTNLNKLCTTQNKSLKDLQILLSAQPLSKIVVGNNLENSIGPTIHQVAIWVLGGLVMIVILSACFNYTNLSIARSLRRSREVGVRKVMGALRNQVLGQFIIESVIISLLALVFSFLLFLALREQFLSLNPHIDNLVSLRISFKLIGYFIVFSMSVGIVAGFLPALFFSRLKALQVLKGTSSIQLFRRVNLRKSLIVVQYTLSLIFITTTVIGYHQYKSFLVFDLGFSTENILNIKLQGNKSELLRKELAEIPAVKGIATSRLVTSLGSIYGTIIKYQNPTDSSNVALNFVDERYLPLHGHRLLAGRNFTPHAHENNSTEIIVNQQLLKRFDITPQNPSKALGEQIKTLDGKKYTIVGVLKDFHYGTVERKIEPFMMHYSPEESGGYLNLKINSQDLPATMSRIEEAWKRIDKTHPLEARFYDDQIQEAYQQFSVMVKVIGFLAFLAVIIASMGLFGMVVFMTETKLKEISIRKVMGANEPSLIYFLSKSFIALLILSAVIALPLTYFFFDKVVLVKFAYHQPISLGELMTGFVMVVALACILIGTQTLKAARTNPAKVLRNE